MLVLSRKKRQRIMIGDDIVIEVIEVRNGIVRIGIQAPKEVPISREEIHNQRGERDGDGGADEGAAQRHP